MDLCLKVSPTGNHYGNHLRSFLIYLKGATGVRTINFMTCVGEVFKIEAARRSICNMIMRGSEHLATLHQKMLCAVRKSARLNIDETSWKKNGKLQSVGVFCNKQLAYFSIEKTRGAKVVQKHQRARCCLSRFRNIFSLLHSNAPPKEIHRVFKDCAIF